MKYKHRFKLAFDSLVQSPIFASIAQSLHLGEYHFAIAQEKDFDEILHLVCFDAGTTLHAGSPWTLFSIDHDDFLTTDDSVCANCWGQARSSSLSTEKSTS